MSTSSQAPPVERKIRRLNVLRQGGQQFFLYKVLPALVLLGLWEVWGRTTSSIGIPTASETLLRLTGLLGSNEFWSALATSNQAMFLGYGVTLAIAIPGGLWMGRRRGADAAIQVWLSLFLVTPMAILAPLVIMFLGFGLGARTFVVALFTLPIVMLNARTGVRTVPSDLIDMARSMGANERQLWRYILLPGAAPSLFAGLRIGIGRAITAMIIVEWLMAAVGLGAMLLQFRGSFEPGALFALVIVIVFESLLLIRLIQMAQRRFAGWSEVAIGHSRA